MSIINLTKAKMWQAVATNDTQFDGVFVYAVQTTGIYCRPSCKSRLPKETNVEYFSRPEDAEKSGYRSCKRCTPDSSNDIHADLVQDICRHIEKHAKQGNITLEQLAEQFFVSPYHLQRTFKKIMGITPREYAEAIRLQEFKHNLRTDSTITDAVYAAGYTSNSQLYSQIDDSLGMSPSEYKRGVKMMIHYATAKCPLGSILVATTERGLCAVRLGDTEEKLRKELEAEFSSAQITEQSDVLLPTINTIIDHIEGNTPHLDLPLDIRATAFQKRVWEALRRIPYGETRTYAEVAQAIDNPKAARAVGNACASNPVAVVIPCHRVIKNDGGFGNYRWGNARKQSLLELEKTQKTP